VRRIALLIAASSVAHAQSPPLPKPEPLEVEVEKTVTRDVGGALGYQCDDPALIAAEVKTVDATNRFVVRGVKAGTTLCRVGLDYSRPSVLFDVRVVSARSR
jgi:hypothetical protein